MKNLRFTPAMTFVLHTAISIVVGAIVAGLTALMQIIFTSSDPRVILATAVSAFLAWFTHGFVSLAQNPQTAQAGLDTLSEIKSDVAQHGAAIASLQALAASVPPVPTATPQGTPPVAPQSPVQPQQFAFPYQAGTTFPVVPAVQPIAH